jgi:hypothetical protein
LEDFAMMYGEELHESVGGAVNANAAAATAAHTMNCYIPGAPIYWGYRVSTVFAYIAAITVGLLSLYRYTKTIISATVNVGGTGYAVGDLISVVQTGASGGIVRVLTAVAGVVATVEVVEKGINYVAGAATTVALNGAGDNALTLVIVDRFLVDTMILGNAAGGAVKGVLGMTYMKRVPNVLADVSPTPKPTPSYNAGEQLVMVVTTKYAGAGGETGAYLPIIIYQHRAENIAAQPLVTVVAA